MSSKYREIYYNAVKRHDWEQAKNSLESLGKIEKDNPLVYLKLGDTYQRMGKTVDAIAAYHQSAWIFTKHGFIQKALALYKIILRIDSYNEEAINRSKELMIELESLKVQKPVIPSFEQKFEDKPSIRKEDIIEGSFYSEEPAATAHAPEVYRQEGGIGIQPEGGLSEIRGDENLCSSISSLFSSMPEDEVKYLIEKIEPQIFPNRQMVLEEGDSGDSIFFIKSGSAKVIVHMLGKEIELAVLSAGDVFGEVAFLTGRTRTASVISLDQLEVVEFNKLILEDIFEKYPDVLEKLHDFYQCRIQDTLRKIKKEIKKKDV
ncbi:MAG: hypothetical protein A2Y97_09760 [Nitrospirae bacterium RBG_13_39_12]|nr:MAG: hypothetical protein A2Y97_09760 [Nitrospirae bacterium RBG_13_39_12]